MARVKQVSGEDDSKRARVKQRCGTRAAKERELNQAAAKTTANGNRLNRRGYRRQQNAHVRTSVARAPAKAGHGPNGQATGPRRDLSLIHISEPTRLGMI